MAALSGPTSSPILSNAHFQTGHQDAYDALDAKTSDLAKRILAGIGIAIGVVSFVAAVLVSSSYLWGVAMSVGLVVLSTVLDKVLETVAITAAPSADFIPGQPVGIRNESMNCWCNALLQFMRHVPSIYQHIQNPQSGLGPLRNFYQEYDKAQGQSQTVAAKADSQSIREWFSGRTSISPNSGRQEDASEGLNYVLANSPPHVLELRRPRNAKGEQIIRNQEARSFLINLQGHNNRPLDRLFVEKFLCDNNETQRFLTKPADLTFHLNRNQQWPSRGKIDDDIHIPRRIDLPSTSVLTGEGGAYECCAFISHLGNSMEGGHYVAYVLRNGRWWRCDDSTVTPASMAEVDRERGEAYILHFRAV